MENNPLNRLGMLGQSRWLYYGKIKPKAIYSLTFAVIAASMVITGPSGASLSGPIPVNMRDRPSATTTILNPGVVSWVHIGDLHITTADEQNYADFKTIINNINQYLKNGVNFALMPGDNANDPTESAYRLINQAANQMLAPLYAIPGDHDLKGGAMLYKKYLEPVNYQSFSVDKYHFVFLDVMSGISGAQKSWLNNDLDTAAKAGLKSVIFMHAYDIVSELKDAIRRDKVIMVDCGHTNYNEVANDGRTIYAATRSTGQAQEGPVGFSIINLDNGVVSWKFKPLGSWPFVMITSPSDKSLIIEASQIVNGTVDIRAKIWDDKGVSSATVRIDGGPAAPMARIGATQMWSVPFASAEVSDGDHKIMVNVTGAGGNTNEDAITITVNRSGGVPQAQRSFGPIGNSIGAYAEKGLLGNHATTAGPPR